MNMIKIALPALLLFASSVQAVEYGTFQMNQSALNFAYKQMGVPMQGKFKQFSAQIAFDPAKPGNARAHIDVNLASIDTGSTDANEEVAGKLWFDAKTYPLASFVSSGVKAAGGNNYQVSGKLSIKGKTLDIVTPVTIKTDGKRAIIDGSFNIKRLAYGIGTGEWADLSTVADDVQIVFHLIVFAAPVIPSSTH